MTFADHVFRPWTIDDEQRCIVAPESEWDAARRAATAGKRIAVGEVFRPWDGLGPFRFRLFNLIDSTKATWLLTTAHPENILRMVDDLCMGIGEDMDLKQRFPNLWLGVTASTQAELEERVPALLRVPAAMRVLRLTPRELISVTDRHWWDWRYSYSMYPKGLFRCPIDWVIVDGGDEPMHPDWVRAVRDQCKAAGVPFWFEGWGEWRPIRIDNDNIELFWFEGWGEWRPIRPDNDNIELLGIGAGLGVTSNGNLCAIKHGNNRRVMKHVGRDRSGAVLDGREWRQVPEGQG